MSKQSHSTDGVLLNKLLTFKKEKLSKYIFVAICIWLCTPIISFFLNYLKLSSYTYNGIMMVVLYFTGCICLIFGGIYLFQVISESTSKKRDIIEAMLPFVIMLLLAIWVIVCTLHAEEKRMAIYGYDSFRDNVITYLFYGGFIFGGFVVGMNNNKEFLIKFFVTVAAIVSLIICCNVLFETSTVLTALTKFSKTNLYDNGTGLSDYYGRFFLLASIFSAYLIISSKEIKRKVVSTFELSIVILAEIIIGEKYSFAMMCIALILIVTLSLVFDKTTRANTFTCFFISFLICAATCFVLFKQETINLFLSISAGIDSNKIKMWEKGFQDAQNAIVLGIGPQNTIINYQSVYLQILVYLGGMGLLLLLSLMMVIVKRIPVKRYVYNVESGMFALVATLAYLILGLFLPTVFTLSPYFCILFGTMAINNVKIINCDNDVC